MRDLVTFRNTDLPNMATHCKQHECGFSLYRGVLVQWDEDHDERVLHLLDNLPSKILDNLLVVQEHEAMVSFVWRSPLLVPHAYRHGQSVYPGDGDAWVIVSGPEPIKQKGE